MSETFRREGKNTLNRTKRIKDTGAKVTTFLSHGTGSKVHSTATALLTASIRIVPHIFTYSTFSNLTVQTGKELSESALLMCLFSSY